MTEEQDTRDVGRLLEAEIASMAGVLAARVVTGQTGRIAEVHVVASSDKAPKQVVRDIQTLAQARFAISLDYRVVSVVQMDGRWHANGSSSGPAGPRLVLSSVSWRKGLNDWTVGVEVAVGGRAAAAERSGPASGSERLRLAAHATLDAVAEVTASPALVLLDVRVADVGTRPVVVCLVGGHGGSESVLAGAAVVTEDATEAAVRATLDAVNRRISLLLEDRESTGGN